MEVKKIALLGTVLPMFFIVIVVYLHWVQSDYDANHQFMSELALGPKGSLMIFAFCALGSSVAALAIGLLLTGAHSLITILLFMGATGFIGAGFVSLNQNANVHIGFVALSFVTVAFSMYLLPRASALFKDNWQKVISWALGVGLGFSVALGSMVIPPGVGQRISALFLITWVVWACFRLFKLGTHRDACHNYCK